MNDLPDYVTVQYLLREVFFTGMWLIFWSVLSGTIGVTLLTIAIRCKRPDFKVNGFDIPCIVFGILAVVLAVIFFYNATAHFITPEYYVHELLRDYQIHAIK